MAFEALAARRGLRRPAPQREATTSLGALDRIRTCDLPFRRGLLYPLSYEGARQVYVTRERALGAPG